MRGFEFRSASGSVRLANGKAFPTVTLGKHKCILGIRRLSLHYAKPSPVANRPDAIHRTRPPLDTLPDVCGIFRSRKRPYIVLRCRCAAVSFVDLDRSIKANLTIDYSPLGKLKSRSTFRSGWGLPKGQHLRQRQD
jgi:hypothetical protein